MKTRPNPRFVRTEFASFTGSRTLYRDGHAGAQGP